MGRSANRPILFEIAPPDLPRRALLYVNKRPDQPPLKTASLSSDLSGFDDFTADGGCPKPPPKPLGINFVECTLNFPAKDPNSLLSRTCSISNLKKNTTRMASPTLTTPATARLFVAVAAAVAAPTAVIAHPFIVNRNAPILSILSWRILYSSVRRASSDRPGSAMSIHDGVPVSLDRGPRLGYPT
jgi:hypothetical protein